MNEETNTDYTNSTIEKEVHHTCCYCGQEAHYQLKNGKWCCQSTCAKCPAIKKKNSKSNKGHPAWNKGKPAWNKGLTKEINESIMKQALASSLSLKGRTGHPHKIEFKQKQRERALERHLGGFHMRRGIDYNGIKLDSSYEVTLAKDLDQNGIRWERCKRFPYHIDGKLHYYTPDFYLPDYDIYLDPKNDFLIENVNPRLGFRDLDKIDAVQQENKIKIIVLNKFQLSWSYIQTQV